MVDPLSTIATVGGLIGGIVQLVSTITNLKERWDYAELNITSLSSTLWTVKAALEEIAEWRSTTRDKSPKSEQLDTNLELCIQGTAVLVAYMENRLKDIKLEDLSKFDKAKFVNLDTLFRNLSNDLGAQVRALQLLLTTYQCRTLAEQNERLQRKDTRRIMRAARESTTGIQYGEKDIEDAASILSEAPTTNFEFDRILMQHQNYSKTYPRLYAQMMQNFPTRRSSTISTEESRVMPVERPSRIVVDPLIGQIPNLPFLGVPFEGEVVFGRADEVDGVGLTHHNRSAELVELNNQRILAELKEREKLQELEEMPKADEEEVEKSERPAGLTKPGQEATIDDSFKNNAAYLSTEHPSRLGQISVLPAKDESVTDSGGNSLERNQASSEESAFKHTNLPAKTWPIVNKRRSSFNSLYDDSDEEATEHQPKFFPQNHLPHKSSVRSLRNNSHQTAPQLGRSPAVSTKFEEQASVSAATASPMVPSSDIATGDHAIVQEVAKTLNRNQSTDTTKAESQQGSAKIMPTTHQTNNSAMSRRDVSAHAGKPSSGDKHQLDFMSDLLENFSLDRDIDLQITPKASSFGEQQTVDSLMVHKPSENDSKSSTNTKTNKQGMYDTVSALNGNAPATQDGKANDSLAVGDDSTETLAKAASDADLPEQIIVYTPPSSDIEAESSDEAVLSSEEFHPDEQEFSEGDHQQIPDADDQLPNSRHEENKAEIQNLTVPRRPPPPIPRISKEVEDSIPTNQCSPKSLPSPSIDYSEIAATETAHPSGLSSPRNNFSTGVTQTLHKDHSRNNSGSASIAYVQQNNENGSGGILERRITTDNGVTEVLDRQIAEGGLQIPASAADVHSHRATSSITSVESSATSRNSTSGETGETMATRDTSDSLRVIADPFQHENARRTITKTLSQLSKGAKPSGRSRLSTFASKLNLKSNNERNAKAQQLAQVITAGNASGILFVIGSFDKSTDISTPVSINGEKEPMTALTRAARLGNTEIMEVLLEHDPQSIITVDASLRTALHHSITANASLAVLWLVNYLKDTGTMQGVGKGSTRVVDMKDVHGISAVHLAAALNDVFLIETMRKASADFGAKDNEGRTVLEYAVQAHNFNMAQYLLKQRLVYDINSRNNKGETALMVASRVNDSSSLSALLSSGANKDVRDNNGDMAIHYAARYGNLECLEILFQSIEDITAKNAIGEQPLHLAAMGNHAKVLSALLRIPGIEANAWTEPPHLRQHVKREQGLAATVKLASTALHYACSAGQHQAADVLLERGARVNSSQEDGYSALMMACQAQSSAIVSLLLLHDADPKGSTSAEGLTALHISCKLNDVASTRMLLEHGANPLARLTVKSKETPDGLARRDNSSGQLAAADICTNFRHAMLRDRWGLNRPPVPHGPSVSYVPLRSAAIANTGYAPNAITYPPNIRPVISPLGFPTVVPTANHSIGMPGTPRTTDRSTTSGDLLPPPYQA